MVVVRRRCPALGSLRNSSVKVLHTLQGVCVACELFSWHSQIRCVEVSHRVSALPVTAARSDWPQRETISSEFGVIEQSLRADCIQPCRRCIKPESSSRQGISSCMIVHDDANGKIVCVWCWCVRAWARLSNQARAACNIPLRRSAS